MPEETAKNQEPLYPSAEQFKRHIAYKLKISEILNGTPILDADRLRFLEINNKQIARVNIIANITEKFIQDQEKKFASVTIDDASGQIRLKLFGDDIKKFENFSQGDTIMVIGLVRQWNNELYLTPEIIKKKDTNYLILRKLEIEQERPKPIDKSELNEIKNKMLDLIKKEEINGGINVNDIVTQLNSSQDVINKEVKKLLEEGVIYEPRPGKLRYLG